MAKVENLERLVITLQKKAAAAKVDGEASVIVGYTANYALYVHENLAMKWRGLPRDRSVRLGEGGRFVTTGHTAGEGRGLFWGPTGQAKFLEQPARELKDVFAKIVRDAMARKSTLAQALLLAGLRLQRESQKLVPVDTGNLRASAFTRIER